MEKFVIGILSIGVSAGLSLAANNGLHLSPKVDNAVAVAAKTNTQSADQASSDKIGATVNAALTLGATTTAGSPEQPTVTPAPTAVPSPSATPSPAPAQSGQTPTKQTTPSAVSPTPSPTTAPSATPTAAPTETATPPTELQTEVIVSLPKIEAAIGGNTSILSVSLGL